MSTFKNLKPGQVLSETAFYKVEKVVGNEAQFQAENGDSVILNEGYVNSFLLSGDNYSKEEAVTRTEMSDILLRNPFRAMTVNFNKQVKETDIIKEIQDAHDNSTPKEFTAKMKAAIKRSMAGEERTMVGRHFGSQDEFGRVQFVDMGIDRDFSKDYDTRQRLMDTRTLNWMVVNDIKYTIKKK